MRPVLLLTLLLAACGQRGDLYLPTESPAPPEAVPPQPPQPQIPPTTDTRKKDQK